MKIEEASQEERHAHAVVRTSPLARASRTAPLVRDTTLVVASERAGPPEVVTWVKMAMFFFLGKQ